MILLDPTAETVREPTLVVVDEEGEQGEQGEICDFVRLEWMLGLWNVRGERVKSLDRRGDGDTDPETVEMAER